MRFGDTHTLSDPRWACAHTLHDVWRTGWGQCRRRRPIANMCSRLRTFGLYVRCPVAEESGVGRSRLPISSEIGLTPFELGPRDSGQGWLEFSQKFANFDPKWPHLLGIDKSWPSWPTLGLADIDQN